MTELIVIKVLRDSIATTLLVAAPMLGVGVIVGLIVAIIQTTTSIQEQTLTFVPKIIAIFFTIIVFASWMIKTLITYTYEIFSLIEKTGM
jgi:flagellar biosynthetic protein FliQ